MEARLRELQDHVDAVDAFAKSDDVKESLTALDRGAGRFLGPALAAVWTIVALIAAGAGYIAWRFLEAPKEAVVFAIAGSSGVYAIWRIYRTIKNPPKVSEMIANEIEDRAKPAKTALGFIKFASGLVGKS